MYKYLGDQLDGPERAEKSILDFGITSPIIIITGVADLAGVEKKHGKIFFAYVHKSDYNKQLLPLVEKACTNDGRFTYIKDMLTEFAKRFKILHYEIPEGIIENEIASKLFYDNDGKTIKDLILIILAGSKPYLSKMGQVILHVINHARKQKE